MGEIRTFRDLIAWQRGRSLVKEVYALTAQLPSEERFGLCNQMRRSAVSIPSNIAEGHARGTTPEFIKLLRIARASLAELDTQLVLCVDLGFVADTQAADSLLAETDRVLQGLIRRLEAKLGEKSPLQ